MSVFDLLCFPSKTGLSRCTRQTPTDSSYIKITTELRKNMTKL